MMREELNRLLAHKESLESRAATDAALRKGVDDLRLWQSQRLERTYGELRGQSRFIPALNFFLADLYGPKDFSRRDSDLRRALGRLQRALPDRLLQLLCRVLELQVLTLELDQQMAATLGRGAIDADSYAAAYRKVGDASDRQRQIDLIVLIGEELGRLVHQPWIGVALRAAHVPSRIGGFGVLQGFLERGFAAFKRMGDPKELLDVIRARETALMQSLLRGDGALLGEAAWGAVNHG